MIRVAEPASIQDDLEPSSLFIDLGGIEWSVRADAAETDYPPSARSAANAIRSQALGIP